MKDIKSFLSENFQFWGVKFSIYLNRHVFIMYHCVCVLPFILNFLLIFFVSLGVQNKLDM